MGVHKPTTIWSFRGKTPFDSFVRTANDQAIDIHLVGALAENDPTGIATTVRVPRSEALLLARRLLQCLAATKGRR